VRVPVGDSGRDSAQIVGGRASPFRPPTRRFAAALDRVAATPADRQALGLRARQRVAEAFSLDVAAARYLDTYRSVARP
jgi:glycosyltransferase involved in cell wall biosynthesis